MKDTGGVSTRGARIGGSPNGGASTGAQSNIENLFGAAAALMETFFAHFGPIAIQILSE